MVCACVEQRFWGIDATREGDKQYIEIFYPYTDEETVVKKRIIEKCVNILIALVAVGVAAGMVVRVATIVIGGLIIVSKSYEKKYKPDDLISEAIYEAVGDEKVRYCGKQLRNPGNLGVSAEYITYTYQIRDHEDANLLTDMVEAANAVIKKDKTVMQKINLVIEEEFVSGAYRTAVSLQNYYEGVNEYIQYKSFQNLYIGETVFSSGPYGKASTYTTLPDIRRLCVIKEIAQDAEEEGIDWCEIWPDLEWYEVLED